MGLFRVIEDNNSQIAIWKVTESEQELKEMTGIDLSNIYTYPRRRIERMVTRAILDRLNHFEPLNYYPNGRPYYYEGTPHISISHTSKIVVVGFSQSMSVGVDIERTNRDFKIVANKYLTKDELQRMNLDHQKSLALAWCAKETVYKLPWGEGKCYTTDINILDFNAPSEDGLVNVDVNDLNVIHHLQVKYHFFDEFCLSWVLSDQKTLSNFNHN
jgi:4'-phosphopantetheinyl transferase